MNLEYRPADKKSAGEFLRWQYQPPFELYNCPPEKLEEAIRYTLDSKNNIYAIYTGDGGLVAYCSYGNDAQVPGGDYSEESLDIGLMLKPELTGHGLGQEFARRVVQNGIHLYGPEKIRVTIASFNKRAIRTWEKIGFQQVNSFARGADGMEFVIMTMEVS